MTGPEPGPSTEELLQKGIQAARARDFSTARPLLEQVVARDERNEVAWFWLAAVAQSPEEKRAHLAKVIEINPLNDRAKRLLDQLESRVSAPAEPAPPAGTTPEAAAPSEPRTLNVALIVGVLAVIGLVIVVALLLNRRGDDPQDTAELTPDQSSVQVQPTEPAPVAGEADAPADTAPTPTSSIPTRTPVPTWTPAPSATPLSRGPATPLAPPPTGLGGQIVIRSGLVLGDERLQPIVMLSPDGSGARTVSENGERGTSPALSPGGNYLAYVEVTSTREEIIKVIPLTRPGAAWFWGGTPRLDRQDMPAWSPDGNWIAFTATGYSDQLRDLYLVTGFAGGEATLERLTEDNSVESWPSFSPDGTQLVYSIDMSPSGGATELRVLDIASRQFRNLTGNGNAMIESSPDWSPNPDLPYIVFHAQEAETGKTSIYWVPANGSAPAEKLIESDANDVHPRFSPDGRHIVFSSDRTGNWDVFVYTIETGDLFQLTTGTQVDIANDWAQ